MKAQEYAQALYVATRGKEEEEAERILQNFIRILEMHGHKKILTSVERELEKLVRRYGCQGELHVRVANENDADVLSSKIERDIQTLGADTLPRKVVVDETLVGGYELRALGTRIDRTYKRSLLTLYNKLITN
jgi:F0F1-type ATP synthase delta subunit